MTGAELFGVIFLVAALVLILFPLSVLVTVQCVKSIRNPETEIEPLKRVVDNMDILLKETRTDLDNVQRLLSREREECGYEGGAQIASGLGGEINEAG